MMNLNLQTETNPFLPKGKKEEIAFGYGVHHKDRETIRVEGMSSNRISWVAPSPVSPHCLSCMHALICPLSDFVLKQDVTM